ncbi:plectin-like, partial [Limulus polyphemus]|uniref:Plectin-like n=1 Tax=Limulus polyphemus TaxID=6850 RepID=A0ABM1BY69_LIMPO
MQGSSEPPFPERDDMSVTPTGQAGIKKEKASSVLKRLGGPRPALLSDNKWELVIPALKVASITSIALALAASLIGVYLFTNSGTSQPKEPHCSPLKAPFVGRQFTCGPDKSGHCPVDWVVSLAGIVILVNLFFAALFRGLLVRSSPNMFTRRHTKGSRQPQDPDTLVQTSSSSSSQEFRSSFSTSEVRTVQTSQVIRKTTTLSQGDGQQTVTTSEVTTPGRTVTTHYVVKQESSSTDHTDRSDKKSKVQRARKTREMTQGDDQQTVTTSEVTTPGRTVTTHYMVKQESSSTGHTDHGDKKSKVQRARKTREMTQRDDQQTVTTSEVTTPGQTVTTHHVVKQESSSTGLTDRGDKKNKAQRARKTQGTNRVTKKPAEMAQTKQISDIIGQTDKVLTAREALLLWAQRTTDRYPGVKVTDFTKSWKDGLAFNAILHRNRPDLIDWRTLRIKSPRDNLELAFSVLEKECGVTRLLDPEDVDTPDPDERSLITYISSLYDVFSEPPEYHPFADSEKLRKVEEYKELASTLNLWIQGMTRALQDHTFPCTLVEVKALLVENNKLRVTDIPPKLHDKQKLFHLYTLLQNTFRETGSVDIETELQFDTIEKNWNQLMLALQTRDQAIRDEISRLEKLQRLAEKLHREAKQCDRRIDDIEKKVIEEEMRIQRLHSMDAVQNCDQIQAELNVIDENIQTMFKEVESLRDGHYHQTHEVHKRVQNLHQRWITIHTTFTTTLLNPLSTRVAKTEERQVTKRRQVAYEQHLVETNEAFKFLQECLDWVNGKLKFLHSAEYGGDLPSVKSLLEKHQTEHQAISQFHRNIDQCATRKNQFRGDEQELYCRLLSKLEKNYSELVILSNRRLTDLEILLDFIQSSTNELMWMNRKEEIEVTRDWSSVTLNIVEIEQYQETFSSELEKREIQFNAITDRGQSLKLQKHPASNCIEAYLSAMQSQWYWLLQLSICLDEHLRNASSYHQFFTEAKECEQWLAHVEEQLTTTFSRKTFPIDEGESLLKQMLDLKEDMTHYKNIVISLVDRSKGIVPLKQRRQPLSEPLKITAICSYKQLNMTIIRKEECWLHDNSQKIKWKVINSAGTEGLVPGVCFVIPPPNFEATDLAQ